MEDVWHKNKVFYWTWWEAGRRGGLRSRLEAKPGEVSDSQVRGSGEEGWFVVRTGSVQVKTKNKHLVQWKQKKHLETMNHIWLMKWSDSQSRGAQGSWRQRCAQGGGKGGSTRGPLVEKRLLKCPLESQKGLQKCPSWVPKHVLKCLLGAQNAY